MCLIRRKLIVLKDNNENSSIFETFANILHKTDLQNKILNNFSANFTPAIVSEKR